MIDYWEFDMYDVKCRILELSTGRFETGCTASLAAGTAFGSYVRVLDCLVLSCLLQCIGACIIRLSESSSQPLIATNLQQQFYLSKQDFVSLCLSNR